MRKRGSGGVALIWVALPFAGLAWLAYPLIHIYADADDTLLDWPRGEGVPPPAFAEGYPETLVRWIKDPHPPR